MLLSRVEQEILDELAGRRPDLVPCTQPLLRLHQQLIACYDAEGVLYTCGNGGSHTDAVHIVGELNKSFERRRTLPADYQERLQAMPFGPDLATHLEAGLRSHALGLNGALKTAVENDIPLRDIAFAQELNALVRPGDVLLAISTSGNAANCRMAMSVARAHGACAVALTGRDGGAMAREADIAIVAPGDSTKVIQEAHIALWHAMCCLIEAHYFPEAR
ncbi:MAG: phosphoheptose isomerase [Candidatus Hydrogenedentota bacterium]|jgi:D-sedoheptulose 7-phosphate isomerase